MNTTLSRKVGKKRKPAYYTAKFGHKKVHVYRRTTPSGNWAFMVADTSEVDDKGKIKRLFRCYSDEVVAKQAADTLAERLGKRESTAMRLSESKAMEHVNSEARLKPFNVTVDAATSCVAECLKTVPDLATIHAAIRFFAARNKQVVKKAVADAVTEFRTLKAARGASERYKEDLKSRLDKFAEDCKKDVANVGTADVQAWLDSRKASDGKPLAPQSYTNFRRVLSTFFGFCVTRGYCVDNAADGVERLKVNGGEIEVFTPSEISRLLTAASPDFLPSLAIGAFAGLRSAEIERLNWQNVNLAEKIITVGAATAKTASRRLVPISDNLAAWLADYAKREGKVWPGTYDMFYKAQEATAAATEIQADPEKGIKAMKPVHWKANALRHSFISYRLAEIQNAAQVALEAGNSAQMVFKHYRQIVKAADAQRWFDVRPAEAPSNVLPMSAAATVKA